MKVSELQNGQVVRARLGRYVEVLPAPQWGLWESMTLYVQRNASGAVCIITPAGGGFAEFDPKFDKPKNGVLSCEGYYMEIEGLEDE